MKRRAFLIAGTVWALRADDASDVWELFTDMAAALGNSEPDEFLRAFDRNMPGYADL